MKTMAEFKVDFTRFVNANQTNLLVMEDTEPWKWDIYYDAYLIGDSYDAILDGIFEDAYGDMAI